MAKKPTAESAVKRDLFTPKYGHRVEQKQKGRGSYNRSDFNVDAEIEEFIDEYDEIWKQYLAEQKENERGLRQRVSFFVSSIFFRKKQIYKNNIS